MRKRIAERKEETENCGKEVTVREVLRTPIPTERVIFKHDANFEWPKFKNDRERIKFYSRQFKDCTMREAFSKAFDLDLSNVNEEVDDVPNELAVGDIIKVRIRNINKSKVEFDNANYKANIQSCVNLHKYAKFKDWIPVKPLTVCVTNVTKDRVTVDPIMPLLNTWMNTVLGKTDSQRNMNKPTPIKIKNLQLTRGGFIGQAVIPNVSKFVGEDYTMDAFIPGSQIVLNITDDFEQFVGKDVDAFVLNYMSKPGNNGQMSLICSAKEYLTFLGQRNLIDAFNNWCENNDTWKKTEETVWKGNVTGVINSSKKCGVFVEIPELNVTGMVSTKPEELVNYKPHDEVKVKVTGFEEEMFYNQAMKQLQHVTPYVIEDDILKKCTLKPILKFEEK